jgi:putative protease
LISSTFFYRLKIQKNHNIIVLINFFHETLNRENYGHKHLGVIEYFCNDYMANDKKVIQPMEIMSPVGSHESLMAAIQGGAGSVYFGIGKLNMRSRSSINFSIDDLKSIVAICSDYGVKTYLTLNTIIYVNAAVQYGVSAIIASDISVMEYARKKGVEVHISTQCNITNIEAVKFYSQFADVMVTARELTLDQVAAIGRLITEKEIKGPSGELVKLEIFAHGALCMAISGKCYLSLDHFNQSANRGACYQPCRRAYTVIDKESEVELEIDHEYIMSPKDLCTIGFLDKISQACISVLKIEGRGRSAEYVKTVTECYHEANDSIINGTYTREKIDGWMERLKSVYNRGFWDGYYLGRKMGEWSERYGSQATKQKLYIGKITNYFSNLKVAEIHIDTYELLTGDEIIISGPTTGIYEMTVEEIQVERKTVDSATKGEDCSIAVAELVRRGDKVYKLISSSIE